MELNKIKLIALWVFILPFVAVNSCLFVVIFFTDTLPVGVGIGPTFPYFDGGTSISRTARNFPTSLIFKPAMLITSYLLIKYWTLNKNVMLNFYQNEKKVKIFLFFGIMSAVSLALHSIFLGIKFEYDLYKLFRRVILLSFIIFELVAQIFLVICLYKIKNNIENYMKYNILKIKIVLVSILSVVTIVSIPLIAQPGNKYLKHALEWDFFLGIILFYLLTFLMWKKQS